MSSYNGNDLFGSGTHRFVVHGVEQRHAEHELPAVDGARITPLGKSARRIDQTGVLVADDLEGMFAQRDAIEAAMDGQPAELIDDRGRPHRDVVMLVFDCGAIRRLGPRLAMDYTVRYAQVEP
jgi:hypothetical protein